MWVERGKRDRENVFIGPPRAEINLFAPSSRFDDPEIPFSVCSSAAN